MRTPTPLTIPFVNDFARDVNTFKALKIKAANAHYEFTVAQYRYQSALISHGEFELKRRAWIDCVKEMRHMLISNPHDICYREYAY